MTLLAPVSWGELIDKITILEIKSEKISDESKLLNVRRELAALNAVVTQNMPSSHDITEQKNHLKTINLALWQIEDDIRECERQDRFDAEFIRLARAVYVTNDQRAAVKKEINLALGSQLVEEKSYAAY